MKLLFRKGAFAGLLALAITFGAQASPCSSIDQTLTSEQKANFGRSIASQLQVANAEVLQSFQVADWHILYIDTHAADEAFLFFSSSPESQHYLTLWSGAAAPGEEQDIRTWALSNAPGIPTSLANCFAWHVTKDRTR